MSRITVSLLLTVFLLLACLNGGLISGCRAVVPTDPPAVAISQEKLSEKAQPFINDKPYLECRHYSEKGFLQALEHAVPYSVSGRMLAAISPHFLPAMTYTANILSALALNGSSAPLIYVLAPNHSGEGLPLLVADRGWTTPFGALETDEEAVAILLKSPQLINKIDIDLYHLESDHSAATLMPFIKYYLPEARVVTVLLNKGCPLADLEALAAAIYESGQIKDVFVLASVDFSHYLNIEETAVRDKTAEELIYAKDLQGIKSLDSGYLDSPEAVIVLISYAARFSGMRVKLWDKVILPESAKMPHIGYSYNAYIFSVED